MSRRYLPRNSTPQFSQPAIAAGPCGIDIPNGWLALAVFSSRDPDGKMSALLGIDRFPEEDGWDPLRWCRDRRTGCAR